MTNGIDVTELKTYDVTNLTSGTTRSTDAPSRLAGFTEDPRTVRRRIRKRMARLSREANAREQIGRLPKPGEDVVLILTGNWHGFDMLGAILELAGCAAEHVMIATLGFNRFQTDTLTEMVDEHRIHRLTFMVSHMFTEKNAGEFDYLREALESRGQRLANSRNHAKLMLILLEDNRHIVTHGSLNLRRCNSFEQLVITQDYELFQFFAQFIEDAIAGGIQP